NRNLYNAIRKEMYRHLRKKMEPELGSVEGALEKLPSEIESASEPSRSSHSLLVLLLFLLLFLLLLRSQSVLDNLSLLGSQLGQGGLHGRSRLFILTHRSRDRLCGFLLLFFGGDASRHSEKSDDTESEFHL
ncbi:hypothetical protein PFISCL1PPCAC_6829, partial [Pristionchus fissidentatus]